MTDQRDDRIDDVEGHGFRKGATDDKPEGSDFRSNSERCRGSRLPQGRH